MLVSILRAMEKNHRVVICIYHEWKGRGNIPQSDTKQKKGAKASFTGKVHNFLEK